MQSGFSYKEWKDEVLELVSSMKEVGAEELVEDFEIPQYPAEGYHVLAVQDRFFKEGSFQAFIHEHMDGAEGRASIRNCKPFEGDVPFWVEVHLGLPHALLMQVHLIFSTFYRMRISY